MKPFVLCIAVITLGAASFAQKNTATIVERSVETNALDWAAAANYDYYETDRQPGGGTKTYAELMILGSPYEELISVNGKPLAPQRQAEELQKLQTEIVHRRSESNLQRADRIAKYEKDRRRDHLLMEQLTKAFDFVLVGQQKMDGYDVYVLKATPRADYKPPNLETEVLKGMEGKLWIDKQTFQWVKVEAQVIRPVSIEGFLARVEPGTRFELGKMPVEDDIWLPRHFAMRSRAKVLFLFTRKTQTEETYYGYHTFSPSNAGENN
jgi:outer membrane lipoprotein-sorting protein